MPASTARWRPPPLEFAAGSELELLLLLLAFLLAALARLLLALVVLAAAAFLVVVAEAFLAAATTAGVVKILAAPGVRVALHCHLLPANSQVAPLGALA